MPGRKKIVQRKRGRNNAKVGKGKIFNTSWIHSDYLEYWLETFCKDGNVLNVCSGESMFGLVRVDIDHESNATIYGDLFEILKYFRPESFKYVYCDPDYRIYTTGPNRFRWQFDLFSLVKPGGALITRRPKVTVNLPSKHHEYVVCEDSRPSLTLLRIDYK